ncbi:calcium-dependent phosphotriesterase [Gonapodya prolifera JEL478]|uniref:Calcium-dependent phosphotriesterase n=1 Tax=Gonapodya prolifera (strain JEL478) TaxID=1344416 RepID=A0A139AEA6_GONPJ|nr:calcium-dependent phosphotriesterase [Gonapodya prolifera JEL478]|eukprot:KXS14924.1 calcium-dependent phosphotriesterase [Gonapodya prolifera JEL478]
MPPLQKAPLHPLNSHIPWLLIPIVAFVVTLDPIRTAIARDATWEPVFLTRYGSLPENYTLGTEGCVRDLRASGCEDIEVHDRSGKAFMACGVPEARMKWFPAITVPGTREPSRGGLPEDGVYTYDLSSGSLTHLTPVNIPLPGHLRLHGLSLVDDPSDTSAVFIHLVNHAPSGSCLEMFRHTLGGATMEWNGRVCDPHIHTPNDVASVSPTSFYVTNDHYFRASTIVGEVLRLFLGDTGNAMYPSWMRRWEDGMGSLKMTDVVFCELGKNPQCRTAASSIIRANGILLSPDGKTVLVDSSRSGTVLFFDRNETTNELRQAGGLALGAACDNLSYDKSSGSYYVAVFPKMGALHQHFLDPLVASNNAPSGVVRFTLNPSGGFSSRLVYYDSGKLSGDVTVAVSSRKHGKSLLGSVMSNGFVVCNPVL